MKHAGALLLLLLLLSCGRRGGEGAPGGQLSGSDGGTLVSVGDRGLSFDEFRDCLPDDYQGLLTHEEKRQLLDRWVDTELLFLGAQDRGLLEDPEMQRRLSQQRRDYVANAFLQRELAKRVEIGETEITEYYAEHRDEFAWEYRYRQIVVNSQEEAADIHRRLSSRALDFKKAAEDYSLDASSRLGGDMGWMARAGIPPELLPLLLEMKVEEISEPVQTTWGWTLIQFLQRRECPNALDLPELRDEILRHLAVEKRRKAREELLDELRKDYPVTYHSETEKRLGG